MLFDKKKKYEKLKQKAAEYANLYRRYAIAFFTTEDKKLEEKYSKLMLKYLIKHKKARNKMWKIERKGGIV